MKPGPKSLVAVMLALMSSFCGDTSPGDSRVDPADASADDANSVEPDGNHGSDSPIIATSDGPDDITRDPALDFSVTRDTGMPGDGRLDRDTGTAPDVGVGIPDAPIDRDDAPADDAAIDASCTTFDAPPPDAGCGQNGEVCCPNATCAKCSLSCAGAKCTCLGPCISSRSMGEFPSAGTNILRSDGTVWYYATSATRPTVVADENMAPVSGFTKVVTSAAFSCGIKRDRTVWCWWNYPIGLTAALDGQLGDGTQRASQTPVQVITAGPDALTDVVALGTNLTTTCAVRTDATVYCWGNGRMGQLGGGRRDPSFFATPVLAQAGGALFRGADSVCVGDSHVCTHNQDDTVWCWGWNAYSQIGNGTTFDAAYPSEVTTISHQAKQVECGKYYSCARVDDRVYCWGRNTYGMGNGTQGNDIAPVKEPNQDVDFTGVTDLRVAGESSCVLRGASQSLWCWGKWPGDAFEHRYPGQPPVDRRDGSSGAPMDNPYYWDLGVGVCFVNADGTPFLADAIAKYPIDCPP